MIACIEHLREEDALGPVQRDEALFLFGLMRVLRPRVIVEFGYLEGVSARVLQEGSGGRVFSFDCNPRIPDCTIPGVTLVRKRQEDFEWQDVDVNPAVVDVVFFDAGHDLKSSMTAFNRIEDFIGPRGVLIVHDTGTWSESHMQPAHHSFRSPWLSGAIPREKVHRPDERRFVNWLTESGWSAVNFHSQNCLRHGLTILQRTATLPV